jgi:hypothetical protein
MCGGKPKVDNTIQLQMLEDSRRARAEEEARLARIRQGTAKIDQTFAGFDDGFFNDYRNNIMNFYQPQIDDQFGDAQDDLTYAFARAGTLNSTMANEKSADLNKAYEVGLADLLADAQGQVNSLNSNINTEKSNLVSLLNATGDADRAANEALSRSQVLFERQPDYNALPDLFSGIAQGVGGYFQQQNNQRILDTYFGRSGTSGGSGRIVQ